MHSDKTIAYMAKIRNQNFDKTPGRYFPARGIVLLFLGKLLTKEEH